MGGVDDSLAADRVHPAVCQSSPHDSEIFDRHALGTLLFIDVGGLERIEIHSAVAF
jgi:hypothetical protein